LKPKKNRARPGHLWSYYGLFCVQLEKLMIIKLETSYLLSLLFLSSLHAGNAAKVIGIREFFTKGESYMHVPQPRIKVGGR